MLFSKVKIGLKSVDKQLVGEEYAQIYRSEVVNRTKRTIIAHMNLYISKSQISLLVPVISTIQQLLTSLWVIEVSSADQKKRRRGTEM